MVRLGSLHKRDKYLRLPLVLRHKWDNLAKAKDGELSLREEQLLRHQVFAWYLTHWNKSYSGKWTKFAEEQRSSFKFERKTIARPKRLLSENLEFVLDGLSEHCKVITKDSIKNVLLFFYRGTKRSLKVDETFTLMPIDYGKEVSGNFIPLSP